MKNKFLAITIIMVILLNMISSILYQIKAENIQNSENLTNIDSENNVVENNVNNTIDNENKIINNNVINNENSNIVNDTENTIGNVILQDDENTINNTIQNNDISPLIEDENDKKAIQELGVTYRTHVENIGWQDYMKNGEMAGTQGKCYRLEALNIKLIGNDNTNLKIKYQVHVQDIGWQGWKTDDEIAGTQGRCLRLEAIKIRLESSENYSIMYRVHVQDIGWQDWKTDGEIAGTQGRCLRLEAIQIKIVPKVKKTSIYIDKPTDNYTYYNKDVIKVSGWKMSNLSNTKIKVYIDNSKENINDKLITYTKREDVINAIEGYGTENENPNPGFKFDIDSSNLSGGNHNIKVVVCSANDEELKSVVIPIRIDRSLHIEYRAHVENIGWQEYSKDGGLTGTTGMSYRIEAIEIMLENMDDYTVEYQVHIQDKGWTDWYMDGETAGTVGRSKRIEALRIRIVPKKEKRSYKGIDVSQFNGIVNWGLVKRDGIDFAFVRVGFRGYGQRGTLNEDKQFRLNMKGAQQAGVPVGLYFITQAITEDEARQEADWVIERAREYNIDYPIAIDIEAPGLENPSDVPRTQNLGKDKRTQLAKEFCKRIQSAGYIPIVYCNVDWAYNYLNMSELSDYDTWIADYRDTKPGYNGKYSIWQYTSKGMVNGVLGYADRNICYKKY